MPRLQVLLLGTCLPASHPLLSELLPLQVLVLQGRPRPCSCLGGRGKRRVAGLLEQVVLCTAKPQGTVRSLVCAQCTTYSTAHRNLRTGACE